MMDIYGLVQLGVNAVNTVERFRDAYDAAKTGFTATEETQIQPILDKLHESNMALSKQIQTAAEEAEKA